MAKDKRAVDFQRQVATRLKTTRSALRLDRLELAEKLQVSRQRWFNYESGRRPFDMIVAVDLCEKEQLTLEWLFRGIKQGLAKQLVDEINRVEASQRRRERSVVDKF